VTKTAKEEGRETRRTHFITMKKLAEGGRTAIELTQRKGFTKLREGGAERKLGA